MTKAITFRIKPLYGFQYSFGENCADADPPEKCYKAGWNGIGAFALYRIGANNNAQSDNAPDFSALDADMTTLKDSGLQNNGLNACVLLNLRNRFYDQKPTTGLGIAGGFDNIILANVNGLYEGLKVVPIPDTIPEDTYIELVDTATNTIYLSTETGPTSLFGVQKVQFTSDISVAVTDQDAYHDQIYDLIDRYNKPGSGYPYICVVTIENEEGSGNNVQQYIDGGGGVPAIPTEAQLEDPAQSQAIGEFSADLLITQMTTAADAIHDLNAAFPNRRPVVVAPGGIASSGVEYYNWFRLYDDGNTDTCEAAAAYANYAYQGVDSEGDKTIDLPNCDYTEPGPYPGRDLYGNDPEKLRELYQTVRLVDRMNETGMDCANVHVFGGHIDMGPQLRATKNVLQAFNMSPPPGSTKPCWMSDAIGQKDNTPSDEQGTKAAVFTGMGVADAPAFLGLEIVSIFGGRESDGNNSLSIINNTSTDEANGSLNGYGCGVRDTWGDLVRADPDNDTWTKHLAKRGECFSSANFPFNPPAPPPLP